MVKLKISKVCIFLNVSNSINGHSTFLLLVGSYPYNKVCARQTSSITFRSTWISLLTAILNLFIIFLDLNEIAKVVGCFLYSLQATSAAVTDIIIIGAV